MTVASLRDNLYGFAIELRQLAYTMPGGHEDPLIRLSERMVSQARQQAAAGESPPLESTHVQAIRRAGGVAAPA